MHKILLKNYLNNSLITLVFRFDLLKEAFKKKYGEEPSFYCRAPGRVNIIGKNHFIVCLKISKYTWVTSGTLTLVQHKSIYQKQGCHN